MAIDPTTYSSHEWRVGVVAEAAMGTAITNAGTFQLLDTADVVTMSQSLVQNLDQRSGEGRTLKEVDAYTSDYGSQPITVTCDFTWEATVAQLLMENLIQVEMGAAPKDVSIATAHAIAALKMGSAPTATNTGTLTVALISPEDNETIYLGGCVVTELTVTMDGATDAGRAVGSVTFETRHRPANGLAVPTTETVPGTTYTYLRDLCTAKTINSQDVIINKLAYTIKNPMNTAGYDGTNGDPEVIARSIPRIECTVAVGVKYDDSTKDLWETRRVGTAVPLYFADHATWASADHGFQVTNAVITSDAVPAGTDQGAFIDLEFTAVSDKTNPLAEFIISVTT